MNTRGKIAKYEGTGMMNPLNAASTEDESQERIIKLFLYLSFTDHQKKRKKLAFKDEKNKQSYKEDK
jgi:hypothetical protein